MKPLRKRRRHDLLHDSCKTGFYPRDKSKRREQCVFVVAVVERLRCRVRGLWLASGITRTDEVGIAGNNNMIWPAGVCGPV